MTPGAGRKSNRSVLADGSRTAVGAGGHELAESAEPLERRLVGRRDPDRPDVRRARRRAAGPIRATPALSGPRQARASSIVEHHPPGGELSCPPVLSQNPTIPHMPLSLSTIENQAGTTVQFYWLGRPLSSTISRLRDRRARDRLPC